MLYYFDRTGLPATYWEARPDAPSLRARREECVWVQRGSNSLSGVECSDADEIAAEHRATAAAEHKAAVGVLTKQPTAEERAAVIAHQAVRLIDRCSSVHEVVQAIESVEESLYRETLSILTARAASLGRPTSMGGFLLRTRILDAQLAAKHAALHGVG